MPYSLDLWNRYLQLGAWVLRVGKFQLPIRYSKSTQRSENQLNIGLLQLETLSRHIFPDSVRYRRLSLSLILGIIVLRIEYLERYSLRLEESIPGSLQQGGYGDNLNFLHFAAMLFAFLVGKWRSSTIYILSEEGRYSFNKQLELALDYKVTTLEEYNSTHHTG